MLTFCLYPDRNQLPTSKVLDDSKAVKIHSPCSYSTSTASSHKSSLSYHIIKTWQHGVFPFFIPASFMSTAPRALAPSLPVPLLPHHCVLRALRISANSAIPTSPFSYRMPDGSGAIPRTSRQGTYSERRVPEDRPVKMRSTQWK